MNILGEKLKSWRHDAKMYQVEAAKNLKIDATYLSKIENGHMLPGADLLESMAVWYRRTTEESDQICILAGTIPRWVKPALISHPEELSRLRGIYYGRP